MTWTRTLMDVAVVLWWIRLLALLAERPASRWPTRWVGKAATLAVAGFCFATWSGLVIPYGAVLVWWRVLVNGSDPFELPMADGRRMP